MKCDQYLCRYCFTSCAIRRKRTTFKPDELANTFVALNREKRVDGMFLSSGIVPDADTTMEKMLATVERLRLKEPPIVARIENDRVVLDLRTVDPADDERLAVVVGTSA